MLNAESLSKDGIDFHHADVYQVQSLRPYSYLCACLHHLHIHLYHHHCNMKGQFMQCKTKNSKA